ncbi:MAG: calcium/sodium antiporter [Xanthomonadaceae bacterium]|nr:calcium/sodium antiporter [Xanthomonadaceae bacterium]
MLPALAVIVGIAALVWGADRFVVGASGTARNLGMSKLFIGLTVVALGTSAPEMLVSAIAAFNGNPGLAIGNAFGSNIANCALVLGVAAIVSPLTMRTPMLRHEFPVLLGLMVVVWWLLRDGKLGVFEGGLLVAGVVPLLWWMVRLGNAAFDVETAEDNAPAMTLRRSLAWLGGGLAVLLVSSHTVVWGAVQIAEMLGVSDTIIGLSVIAIGTSLPELAASVAGALRNQHEIAVGNVLGSNMFNLLVVLGLPGLIAPGLIDPEILSRDFPVMVGVTVAVFAFAFFHRAPPRLGRAGGAVLTLAFVGYLLLLYDWLP